MEFESIERMRRIPLQDKVQIWVLGIDYGLLTLVKESDTKLLIHRQGRKEWYGLGTQKYYHPSFIVFRKGEEENTLSNPLRSPEFEYKRGGRKEAFKKAMEEFNKEEGE